MNFLTASVDIKVDDSKLNSQLAKARSAVTKSVDKIKRSFTKMGAHFKAVFSKMAKYAKWAFLAITGALLASAKAFASFDDAMQKSVAIMSGVTAGLRLEMEKTAKTISLSSVKSATELAESYFFLASAGLSAEQSIKALSKVEAFAVAGAFDMALATDLVTDAQSALGLTVKDSIQNMKNMEKITDVLIGANTLANASTQQFSEALMRAGPVMKAYGIELEEGVAVLAAYADQGKKAAEGGELFGRMLRLMIKGFNENEEAWRGYGISIVDANDKMRPLADIVRDLTGLLDGMGVTQKARTLDMLGFKARTQQTIMPLLGMGDAIEGYNKKLEEMGGITQRVRDFQLKSFASQMKIVWNNIVSIAIAIGQRLAPHMEALGHWFRENRDAIEGWAIVFVNYILHIKTVLWAFVKFMYADWAAGVKVGLGVSLEIFKGFGKSLVIVMTDVASRAWRAFVKEFGEGLGRWLIEASKPKGVLGKVLSVTPIGMAKRVGMMKAGVGLIEGARAVEPPKGPTMGARLKEVWQEVGASIKEIVPPELEAAFDVPLTKLTEKLGEVGTVAEEIKEPMEEALVQVPEKAVKVMTKSMEEARSKMRQWGSEANDIWNTLADIAVGALNSTADALTDLVLTGKADFAALADSIVRDLTRMIIKQMMFNALSAAFGGTFGMQGGGAGGIPIPGLQQGGEVKKTGLAVVHKGETFSGVDKEAKKEDVTLNINVSAIDAAGTYQFLSRNKRAIATMMQGMMTANHPLRRSKGWK